MDSGGKAAISQNKEDNLETSSHPGIDGSSTSNLFLLANPLENTSDLKLSIEKFAIILYPVYSSKQWSY
jgi:hypothetical protein